jgi:hypothetical protein
MAHTKHKYIFKGILCFFVALSFFATLVPIAGASNEGMPCCVGKEAGHCDSGIAAEKIPLPASEPMCGLDNSEFQDDSNTIVAKPSHKEPHDSFSQTEETSHAAESNSLSKPCQMECGACAASSSRQQRREKSIGHAATSHNPSLSHHSRFESEPFFFSSNGDWKQTSPRGPPAHLL